MPSKHQRIWLLAVLLGVTFLAAQMHFCVDLTANSSGTHFCPICATAAFAVATSAPPIELMPAVTRLEISPVVISIFVVHLREVAPRGPPTSI